MVSFPARVLSYLCSLLNLKLELFIGKGSFNTGYLISGSKPDDGCSKDSPNMLVILLQSK